jgi:hypothetical protein
MELLARYVLNFIFGWLASRGIGLYDGSVFSISVDNAALLIVGVAGSAGVFVWSRWAKRAGRKT